jgi:hypothetical protein
MNLIRTLLHSRTSKLGVTVIAVIALGSLTGVALAQEPSDQSVASDSSTSSDPTTSSTTDPTTSTADPTTSTTDPTTTTTDSNYGSSGPSSQDSTNSAAQTTTTSDQLNQLVGSKARVDSTNPSDDNCATGGWGKVDEVADGDITRTLTYTDVNTVEVVFTFVFNSDKTSATWSSSAPFTGEILVKSSTVAETTPIGPPPQTTGTITSPATNQNGQPQAISHVCVRGTVTETTTTTTDTTTTETTTTTDTTDTTTTDTTTTDTTTGTTSTGSTTTDTGGTTTTSTGEAAGTTAGGGTGGTTNDGNTPKAKTTNGAVAGQVASSSGGLPFTGLHAPLMILVALGMGAAGLALRKRINS